MAHQNPPYLAFCTPGQNETKNKIQGYQTETNKNTHKTSQEGKREEKEGCGMDRCSCNNSIPFCLQFIIKRGWEEEEKKKEKEKGSDS